MTSVLYVTSEAFPLIKTGGLADVSGALPAALRDIGVDCRILIPGYRSVLAGLEQAGEVAGFRPPAGFGEPRLLLGRMPGNGTPVYAIDSPAHYLRDGGPYQDAGGHDYPDNAQRFALLSRVATLLAAPDSPFDWRPDLLHCNDWQAGLAPAFLHFGPSPVPSVMTIHNLSYQGIFPPEVVHGVGLPEECFRMEGVEYYGNFSFLKAGLYYADRITTVSPTYAEEIQREPLGMGMQGLLASRRARLTGILNGIDTSDWNPSSDLHLPCEYSSRALTGKKRCKEALQAELGLDRDPGAPLFGLVSRLAHQKGLDWVLQVTEKILERGAQLAILGTGEKVFEQAFHRLTHDFPGRIAAYIGYDEGLSHRIEAGADLFLMPSRFEPCGLNQMYSLRYGTVPVVHATGGLKDTVRDGMTGFVFDEPDARAFWRAIERALAAYADKPAWRRLMLAGMNQDFSWENSARAYADLYAGMLGTP